MSQRIRYVRGPRCGIGGCKATQYYHQDGQAFCRNNHLVEGELELELEEDEARGLGNRLRQVVADPATLTRIDGDDLTLVGPAARAAVLQGLQLVLRHQCAFLRKELDDPQLESTVKSLWAHWLCAIRYAKHLPLMEDDDLDMSDGEIGGATTTDESGGEQDALPGPNFKEASVVRLQLQDTIGLCYLAMVLHRVPVQLTDLQRWMASEELLYTRAVSVLPAELVKRLPQHELFLFEPRSVPAPKRLWRSVGSIASILARRRGVHFPKLNHAGILFAQARQLYIPIEVTNAAVREFHDITLAGDPFELSRFLVRRPRNHDVPLELKLWAWLLVITRLCYSLDGVHRHDRSFRTPDLAHWQAALETAIKRTKHVDVLSRTDTEAMYRFNDDQIDRYLLWYKASWLSTGDAPRTGPRRAPEGILNLFTAHETLREPGSTRVLSRADDDEAVVRSLVSRPIEPLRRATLAGDVVKRKFGEGYLSVLDIDDQPTGLPIFKDLVELASTLAGVPQEELYKLMRWLETELAAYARVRSQARRFK